MCAYPRTRGEIASHTLECERGALFERRPSNPIVRIPREGGGDVNVWLGLPGCSRPPPWLDEQGLP